MKQNSDYITKAQAAELLQVTPRTIDRWAGAGHLTVYRVPPMNRSVRFDRGEVEALSKPRKGKEND